MKSLFQFNDSFPPTLLLSAADTLQILNSYEESCNLVTEALKANAAGCVIMPDKSSQIFDPAIQNRINCMPATLLNKGISGVKWISVFPENPKRKMPNVTGVTLLSEITSGSLLAIIDASELTRIRTAAVGATAAKYLAPSNPTKLCIIGAGMEGRAHLEAITTIFPSISECRVASRSIESVQSFILDEAQVSQRVKLIPCGQDFRTAVMESDIVVTATSAQAPLLKADWLKRGCLYIHVGGFEDEFLVAQSSDKIVCDDWNAIKHRGSQTISRMHKAGLLSDENIYCNLEAIVTGETPGRENEEEIIYFDSVGLSYIDLMFAIHVYEKSRLRA